MPLIVSAIATRGAINSYRLSIIAGSSRSNGRLAARAGGARVMMGAIRVTFWGGLAMAMTAGIGWLVGAIA